MSLKLEYHLILNYIKTEMSKRLITSQIWNSNKNLHVNKTQIPLKLKCHLNLHVPKAEIPLKLKCHYGCNVIITNNKCVVKM